MSAFDLKLAEMLVSRLCHDLANPIGAVANGVELMAEFCDTMQKDALDLVASSSAIAMKRIAFFRAAYGSVGHDKRPSVMDTRGLAEGFLAGGKIDLDWVARSDDAGIGLPGSALKLVLVAVSLAADALPRGGRIVVDVGLPVACLTATGPGARLDPAAGAIVAGFASGNTPDSAILEPKNVGAAYAGRLAQSIGAAIGVDSEPDRVIFKLRLAS